MMHPEQEIHFLPPLFVQNIHSVFESVQISGKNVC